MEVFVSPTPKPIFNSTVTDQRPLSLPTSAGQPPLTTTYTQAPLFLAREVYMQQCLAAQKFQKDFFLKSTSSSPPFAADKSAAGYAHAGGSASSRGQDRLQSILGDTGSRSKALPGAVNSGLDDLREFYFLFVLKLLLRHF